MLKKEIVDALRIRYGWIHPIIFQRSCEYAESDGDLFDILDTAPKIMPVAWNSSEKRWQTTSLARSTF